MDSPVGRAASRRVGGHEVMHVYGGTSHPQDIYLAHSSPACTLRAAGKRAPSRVGHGWSCTARRKTLANPEVRRQPPSAGSGIFLPGRRLGRYVLLALRACGPHPRTRPICSVAASSRSLVLRLRPPLQIIADDRVVIESVVESHELVQWQCLDAPGVVPRSNLPLRVCGGDIYIWWGQLRQFVYGVVAPTLPGATNTALTVCLRLSRRGSDQTPKSEGGEASSSPVSSINSRA